MYNELYNRVALACCYITVFLGEEKVSDGTGFAYTPNGEVLTAAHVVTGRWPIREEDYKDKNQKIYCKFPHQPLAEYSVFFCSVGIDVAVFTHRIQIDLAVLLPVIPFATPVPHIPAVAIPPNLGDEVFMAGFSEEVRLPFDFDKLLPHNFEGVPVFRAAIQRGYMADMTGPLFKRGFVGNIRRVVAENASASEQVECDVFYIDNSMNTGASGGPVFNLRGEAVGVVSERAITEVDKGENAMLKVPSGSTLAVSLAPLRYISRMTGGAYRVGP